MVKNFAKTKKNMIIFFPLRPAAGFQLNTFSNGKQMMKPSFKKNYEISDFVPKKIHFFQ